MKMTEQKVHEQASGNNLTDLKKNTHSNLKNY